MQTNESERSGKALEVILLAILTVVAVAGVYYSGIKLW